MICDILRPVGSRGWMSPILALACCGVLVTPALVTPAPAATQRSQPPVVASVETTTLTAEDGDGALCLSIADSASACSDPAHGIVVVGNDLDSQKTYVGVAITTAAAQVEVRRAGALLAAAATVDGSAYTGRSAGTLRFALVEVPKSTRMAGLRVYGYDAGGALAAAVAGGFDNALVFDRRRVMAGRAGRARWSIVSNRSSVLTPALFDLAHETVSRCVETEIAGTGGGGASFGATGDNCVSDAPRDRLSLLPGFGAELQVDDECNPGLRLVHGVVDASVAQVTALLGDGTRRRARIAQLPGRAERVYALAIARTHALRSVRLHARSGRTRTIEPRQAPLAVVCTNRANTLSGSLGLYAFGSLDDAPPVTPAGPVTTIPGDPAMRVADGPGDTLCVAVGALPFTALGCAIVGPLGDEGILAATDNLTKPRSVALAVPANVALVRIKAGGRTIREIPTVGAPGYAGRYAGLVRFATANAAPGKSFEGSGIEFLDASGRLLYGDDDTGSEPMPTIRVLPARRIAGRPGAPSLWQLTTRYGSQRLACLLITSGPRPGRDARCSTLRSATTVLLDASCATHRLAVAIVAKPGSRVFAETGTGRRPIALRNGAGILTLAPGTSLRAVRIIRAGRTTRVALTAPPARSQCGWTFEPHI